MHPSPSCNGRTRNAVSMSIWVCRGPTRPHYFCPSPDFTTSIVSQSVTNNRCAPSCGGHKRKVRGHIKNFSAGASRRHCAPPPTCKLLPTPLVESLWLELTCVWFFCAENKFFFIRTEKRYLLYKTRWLWIERPVFTTRIDYNRFVIRIDSNSESECSRAARAPQRWIPTMSTPYFYLCCYCYLFMMIDRW